MIAAGGVCHEQFLAQFTALTVLQHGREGGAFGCEEPCVGLPCSDGFFSRSGFGALGQSRQLALVGNEELVGVGLCHHVVAELQRQQAQLLVDLFESLFLVLG